MSNVIAVLLFTLILKKTRRNIPTIKNLEGFKGIRICEFLILFPIKVDSEKIMNEKSHYKRSLKCNKSLYDYDPSTLKS